ncbi:DnaJ-like protein subfamily C member 28 [Aphelenchoides besseyi]|nr:DnaJ-like protein subfamily C member 28 [Aphelenchoides besseyi]KAI6227079.1 DnaJ-like protein subfamily C member 28 [Aphelenchoides besseyi]
MKLTSGPNSLAMFMTSVRCFSSRLTAQKLRQSYALLELDEDSSTEEVRHRYSQLAFKYHPDTGGQNSDPKLLQKIQTAYKFILQQTTEETEERFEENDSEEKDFGIRHTAPQHRQYLEYGGIGSGTPFARLKNYQQARVSNALDNVREFTIEKTLRETQNPDDSNLIAINQQRKKQRRLTSVIDRTVEDLILNSMSTGEFQNLKGAGKPLKFDTSNPYIDGTQQRINRILRENGFSPPWIMKENEIRFCTEEFRKDLRTQLTNELVDRFTHEIESRTFDVEQIDVVVKRLPKEAFETRLMAINKLIQNYNLIAPSMKRQVMPMQLHREIGRIRDEVAADPQILLDTLERRNQLKLKREKLESTKRGVEMGKYDRNDRSERQDERNRKDDHHGKNRHGKRESSGRMSQHGIQTMKNRMQAALSATINDIKLQDSESVSEVSYNRTDAEPSLTVTETLQRQTQIDKIEEHGFVPATFVSGRGMKKNKEEQKRENSNRDHEASMFGPSWKSKELTKKLTTTTKQRTVPNEIEVIPLPTAPQVNTNFDDFPLAERWLNIDDEVRQRNWTELFRRQRTELFEGTL